MECGTRRTSFEGLISLAMYFDVSTDFLLMGRDYMNLRSKKQLEYVNQELFGDLILRVSSESGIDAAIVEKDYYVSLLLSAIRETVPDIIFKGGTSLSKCYHVIDRFSEDIDLSISESVKPAEGQRRKLKEGKEKTILIMKAWAVS